MSIVQFLRHLFGSLGVLKEEAPPGGTGQEQASAAQILNIRQHVPPHTTERSAPRDLAYRTPAHVKEEFCAHPRRALIVTTVDYESHAVKAHLANPQMLIGEKDALYEYGRFSDPAGDWLVVHALAPQGNVDASLVASKAYQEFGSFNAQMFPPASE